MTETISERQTRIRVTYKLFTEDQEAANRCKKPNEVITNLSITI